MTILAVCLIYVSDTGSIPLEEEIDRMKYKKKVLLKIFKKKIENQKFEIWIAWPISVAASDLIPFATRIDKIEVRFQRLTQRQYRFLSFGSNHFIWKLSLEYGISSRFSMLMIQVLISIRWLKSMSSV